MVAQRVSCSSEDGQWQASPPRLGHAIEVSSTIISDCAPDGPQFQAVLLLLKKAKQTVGFLPDSAVRDRAERGTLLIARNGNEVTGYVLFDLPRSEIRIVQLVVATSARRAGVGRLLIEEVARRNPARRGILLECRRDFEACAVWPRLGFVPLSERPGRGACGKPLTVWWRDFGHPTLFSYLAHGDERPVAALDANIVIDLSDGANTNSRFLAADWVSSASRLAVTDEVYIELERHDRAEVRIRHKRFAAGLDQLSSTPTVWRGLEAAVAERLGVRAAGYAADLRHAAKAAAAGARWLVTRDDRFRRACGVEIVDAWGLSVVSPSAFVLELDQRARGELYRPADLAGSNIEIRTLEPQELDSAARAFVNQRDGERLRDFRARLNDLAANTQDIRATVFADGADLLALSVTLNGVPREIAICRVRSGRTQETLARHMLGWVRDGSAAASGAASGAAILTDSFCGPAIIRAADDEGFLEGRSCRTAFAISGVGTAQALRAELESLVRRVPAACVPPDILERLAATPSTPAAALLLEATFHPYSVVGARLPTFIVPIKPVWARELVDPALARAQLFPRSTGLALQREHVYFRSPRSSGGLSAPARILWYVSGSGAGAMAIRAMSHLVEVVVGDARRLHRRFAHLGVYTEEQVRAAARNGQVMALRFSRTRTIEPPVPLDDYRRLVTQERPGRGLALAGPQPVSEHLFVSVAKMRR